jgi:hypothetical protein
MTVMRVRSIIAMGMLLLCMRAGAQGDEIAPPTTRAATAPSTRPARVKNPTGAIDKLVQIDTASAWSDGTFSNAVVHADYPARIELAYKDSDFPRVGTWTSPETRAAFPFSELIASFNPSCPPNTGVAMDVRVQQDGTWSPWIFLQAWGKTLTPPGREIKWDGGHADIDTLVLDANRPAQRWQARITLYSFEFDANSSPSPSVRRLSVCYSGVVTDPKQREKILEDSNDPTTRPVATSSWARDLAVPFRGQGDYKNPRALWGMICSPTSTSMVLEYYGINHTTVENALAIYDEHYDLFGNWGRAVSRAGELGLDAYLMRFRNWDQVHAKIAEGVPVIASIKFRKGAVKGFLYDETDGHLLVIRGFKDNGDVIVNDPAKREKGNGVIYKADEMAKAWFDNGGVGYVIEKPKRPSGITQQEPSTTQPTDAKAEAR